MSTGGQAASAGASVERTLSVREGGKVDGGYSKSLVCGSEMLQCFTAERSQLGIAELSAELDLSRSTTHRYAKTLVDLGYLEQDMRRRYRLAPRSADVGLALLASMGVRDRVQHHLAELRTRVGYTVSLVVLAAPEVLYVTRLYGHRRGQYELDRKVGVGSRLVASQTAAGRVLLAHLPDGDCEGLLADAPRKVAKGLREDLKRVLSEGISLVKDQPVEGAFSLATTVLGARGRVLAAIELSFAAAAVSETGELERLSRALMDTAKVASNERHREA